MKYCEKCNQTFDIENNRCPFCGRLLTELPDDYTEESNAYTATDIINILDIIEII